VFDAHSGRFLDGIFNPADRWRERSAFTQGCRVYREERELFRRHLLAGDDPSDPEVAAPVLRGSPDSAAEALRRIAVDQGRELAPALVSACVAQARRSEIDCRVSQRLQLRRPASMVLTSAVP